MHRQPVAGLHQKAAGTGELVRLLRKHPDGELLAGKVGVGQLKGVHRVVVDVEHRRGGVVVPARFQLVERLVSVGLGNAGVS